MVNSPTKKCSSCEERRNKMQQRNAKAAKPFQRRANQNVGVLSNKKVFFK